MGRQLLRRMHSKSCPGLFPGVIAESSRNPTLGRIAEYRARISKGAEGILERLGRPNIAAIESDVLPTEHGYAVWDRSSAIRASETCAMSSSRSYRGADDNDSPATLSCIACIAKPFLAWPRQARRRTLVRMGRRSPLRGIHHG